MLKRSLKGLNLRVGDNVKIKLTIESENFGDGDYGKVIRCSLGEINSYCAISFKNNPNVNDISYYTKFIELTVNHCLKEQFGRLI